MNGKIALPTVKRRQCLIWTGALCAIAYAMFAIIAGVSLIKFDFKSYEEIKSYYDFVQLLGLTGAVCYVGGMVSLLVFKPVRTAPYLGLAGGCLYFLLVLSIYCEMDFIKEFIRKNPRDWFAMMSVSVALMLTPVAMLKDMAASGVRYIGMIGLATIMETLAVRMIVYDDYVRNFSTMRTVFSWFELFGQLALLVFYATVLACWNKESGGSAVPCGQSAEDRLAVLQGLKDKNIVTDEEYQSKRKDILSEL